MNKIYKAPEVLYQGLQPIRKFLDSGILDIDGVFLAGAALQALVCPEDKIYDYDVFFTDITSLPIAEAKLKQEGYSQVGFFEFMATSIPTMKTYVKGDVKVQLIFTKIYPTIEKCLETFDFTCTMFAYDGGVFYFTNEGTLDTIEKNININTLLYPGQTLMRLSKYEKKGYTCTSKVYEQVAEAIKVENGVSFFYEGDEKAMTEIERRSRL